MTVHSITTDAKYFNDNHPVNFMLAKNIFNDHFYENIIVDITIDIDKPEYFLYRKLWETVYLNRNTNFSLYDKINKNYVIRISLSEALRFINEATPPILKDKIPSSTSSIINVFDLLTEFLIKDSTQIKYYHSVFCKIIHLDSFQTQNTYNIHRMELLRGKANNLKDLLMDIEILTKNFINNIELIPEADSYLPSDKMVFSQFTFHCLNDNHVMELINAAVDSVYKITNIFKDTDQSLYVTCYTENLIHGRFFVETLKRSYSWVYK